MRRLAQQASGTTTTETRREIEKAIDKAKHDKSSTWSRPDDEKDKLTPKTKK